MNQLITIEEFYKGRDKLYPSDLTPAIQASALITLDRGNQLLARFYKANPRAHRRGCNSGWRPPEVNATLIKNAPEGVVVAKKSNHMVGKAEDIDDDDGELDRWCMTAVGQAALKEIGLWLEHPDSTPRWCHVQTIAPGSGNRVFRVV